MIANHNKAMTLFLVLGCSILLSSSSLALAFAHGMDQDQGYAHSSIRSRSSSNQQRTADVPRLTLRTLQEENVDDTSEDDFSPSEDDPSTSRDDESPSLASSDEDSDSMDEWRGRSAISGPRRRDCQTNQSQDRVVFECKAETESDGTEIDDEIKFTVGATRGDFLRITIEHENEIEIENSTTDTETEVETKFTIVYDRLVEYRKVGTAADNHYEWGVDEVVNEYSLDTWESLSSLETEGDLLKFSASMGIAIFSFTIAQTDSTDITTNKMKIDFLLENYPWAESGDTFIALVSRIETERTTDTDEDGEPDVIRDVVIDFRDVSQTSGFVPFGEYTWADTAEATNLDSSNGDTTMMARQANANETFTPVDTTTTTISVVASTAPQSQTNTGTSGSTRNEIAFAFTGAGQGADRIYWDPEAGVGYATDSPSAAASLVSFAALVAAVVGTALVL